MLADRVLAGGVLAWEGGIVAGFFCYHAGALAVDPARPWQVCSSIGALCGKMATEEQAKRAVEALNHDNAAGTLPCDLSKWGKRALLDGDSIALKTCTGYLSVRTSSQSKRVWTVLDHNQPLCADNESLKDVLTVARQRFGRATLSVWDGDKGEFTSEIVCDPNY